MLTKAAPVRVKAGEQDGLGEGQFEAVVSVFGNVDSYGDVVMPGAFAETLAEWEKSGNPIPVLWSHLSHDPDYHIGYVVEAKETAEGLWVRGQLDLDAPKAKQVYRLLSGHRVTQFSFAYDVLDAAYAERDGEKVYELRKLKVYEVGPTLIGANQETRLIGVKAGQPCPACGQQIDGKATATAPAKSEEPDGAKDEEPNGAAPADVRRLADLDLIEVG
jgi:HK97 family phage prohead protease